MDIDRRYLWVAAGIVLLLVFAGGMKYADMKNQSQNKKEIVTSALTTEKDDQKKAEDDAIQVYVTGAVEKPGVYRLQKGARMIEAVNIAQSLPTANLKHKSGPKSHRWPDYNSANHR
jgi:hypothetical protein